MEVNDVKMKAGFLKKQKVLDHARTVLKEEFIGIDTIIDEIVDNVSSWFFLPDLQDKPVVINLWGLTGVGKTSLVNRLAQLINFGDAYFKFDLGKKEGRFSFKDSLDELCENNDDSPVIIALDEIQHSRTVTGPFRQEVGKDENRMIWELVDSGQIQYVQWKRGLWHFEDMISKLSHLVTAGVEVNKGVVVNKVGLFCKELKITAEEGEEILFVDEHDYDYIMAFAGKELGLHLRQDVKRLLVTLSENETISFLMKVHKIGKRPSVKNFTKALIFVLGNLDEAYTMSANFSADIDADEFNKQSLKINVPIIKKSLQRRFRDEQIARLGNIHIIYPALSRKSYEKIIANELRNYANDLTQKFQLAVHFDHSINKIIYQEGVYPTQGVRPIFTSIHQVLKSKISAFYATLFLRALDVDNLYFTVNGKVLTCEYRMGSEVIYSSKVAITTNLEDVRESKKDDLQAITAVHESGHAVLSMVLMNTIPEVIYSVTTDANCQGFVYSSFAWNFISRKEMLPRVAMILGGYVAEELIFGKEHLTAGASTDILKATEFLSAMFKENGMGTTPISYAIPAKDTNFCFHDCEAIEAEIKQTIEAAKLLAEETLTKERNLLLCLSDYLCDNRMLSKAQIRQLTNESISKSCKFIEEGDHLYYREHLKQQVSNIKVLKPHSSYFENVLSLNKKDVK
tara:strand:+ start:6491 stop:8542 length:2052 start_codon:yes stop_codon:yes gene_type:complete